MQAPCQFLRIFGSPEQKKGVVIFGILLKIKSGFRGHFFLTIVKVVGCILLKTKAISSVSFGVSVCSRWLVFRKAIGFGSFQSGYALSAQPPLKAYLVPTWV